MKTPYSKEDKHRIYKAALLNYKEAIENRYDVGLCYAIYSAFPELNPTSLSKAQKIELKDFPEIIKHEPALHDAYWFPTSNTSARIDILTKAIAETSDDTELPPNTN